MRDEMVKCSSTITGRRIATVQEDCYAHTEMKLHCDCPASEPCAPTTSTVITSLVPIFQQRAQRDNACNGEPASSKSRTSPSPLSRNITKWASYINPPHRRLHHPELGPLVEWYLTKACCPLPLDDPPRCLLREPSAMSHQFDSQSRQLPSA